MQRTRLMCLGFLFLVSACVRQADPIAGELETQRLLDFCTDKVRTALSHLSEDDGMPRRIPEGDQHWQQVPVFDWTSGFWPGILWYAYEHSGDSLILATAKNYTKKLFPVVEKPAGDHDLGFRLFCSFGNGYRLTKNDVYKKAVLDGANNLATLYNPNVGTILSWPGMNEQKGWPHNTIIDNMMNLELLFWAARNGGDHKLYDLAVRHAEVTMKSHVRPDGTTYHVVVFDDKTGAVIKGVTAQGYADNSMWARGQAWGIYGFTMTYRETGKQEFLDTARKLADVFVERLPEDGMPYWDFDAPETPDAPKDASAAAIAASALLELSGLVQSEVQSAKYRNAALGLLSELSGPRYLSQDQNDAFLLHCTGHKPQNSEVDVSMIYADYYFIEALTRLRAMQTESANK